MNFFCRLPGFLQATHTKTGLETYMKRWLEAFEFKKLDNFELGRSCEMLLNPVLLLFTFKRDFFYAQSIL